MITSTHEDRARPSVKSHCKLYSSMLFRASRIASPGYNGEINKTAVAEAKRINQDSLDSEV